MNSHMLMKVGTAVLAVGGTLAFGQAANAGVSPSAAPSADTHVASATYQTWEACLAARNEFVSQFRTVGPCAKGPETYSGYTFLIQPDESGVVTSPRYVNFDKCQSRRHEYTEQFRTTTACTSGSEQFAAYTFKLL